jgi:hypothetical protein
VTFFGLHKHHKEYMGEKMYAHLTDVEIKSSVVNDFAKDTKSMSGGADLSMTPVAPSPVGSVPSHQHESSLDVASWSRAKGKVSSVSLILRTLLISNTIWLPIKLFVYV